MFAADGESSRARTVRHSICSSTLNAKQPSPSPQSAGTRLSRPTRATCCHRIAAAARKQSIAIHCARRARQPPWTTTHYTEQQHTIGNWDLARPGATQDTGPRLLHGSHSRPACKPLRGQPCGVGVAMNSAEYWACFSPCLELTVNCRAVASKHGTCSRTVATLAAQRSQSKSAVWRHAVRSQWRQENNSLQFIAPICLHPRPDTETHYGNNTES